MSVVSQVDTIVCAWVIDRQFLAPCPTVHSSPPPLKEKVAHLYWQLLEHMDEGCNNFTF